MRKFVVVAFFMLIASFLVSPCIAADDIASTIKSRYSSLTSFKAFFSQHLTRRETGTKEKREGVLLFKKPLLINWKTKAPHAENLIVTEKEIWDYLPDEKLAYRYTREIVEDSRSVIQVVTGQALLSKDFDVKAAGTEGKLSVLRLYPKDPTPQLVEATIYVDSERGYILRAVITDFYGNTNDVRFTSFVPDESMSSKDFSFKAPKGVEVEDRIRSDKVKSRDLFN